jgi:uncharacterized membrane protein
MTTLARQSVGLAFFAGIILVLFDPIWDRKRKAKVIILLTFGLSVSHYSSAYIYSIIFLLAGLVSFVLSKAGPLRRKAFVPVTTIRLGLAIVAITFLWNGALNNSAQDINTVSKILETKGPQFLPSTTGNFIDRWINGTTGSTQSTPGEFKSAVLEYNAFNFPTLKPDPISLTYEIAPAEYPKNNPPLGLSTATFFSWFYTISNTTLQFLILLQIILAMRYAIGFLPKRGQESQHSNQSKLVMILLDLIPLTFVSFLVAFFLRISGTVGALYNPERAALQVAFIFSLSIALLLESFLRATKRLHHICTSVLVLTCFVFLQSNSGLIGYIYGSPSGRLGSFLSGANSFVISENERNAADWIDQNIPTNSYLQSDNFANLVNLQTNIFDQRLFIGQTAPFGMFIGSYVYLSKTNLESGLTSQSVGGIGSFRVPFDYLDQNRSVVYSSEGARVYR